jgi:hypothetical protein
VRGRISVHAASLSPRCEDDAPAQPMPLPQISQTPTVPVPKPRDRPLLGAERTSPETRAHERIFGVVTARSLARRTIIEADPVEHKPDPKGYGRSIFSQPV